MKDLLLQVGSFRASSLDYVMVVDRSYRVLYNSRFDSRIENSEEASLMPNCGQSFFELYPTLQREESSIVEVMNTGKIVERINQRHVDYNGKVYFTNNLSIPIIRDGLIIGAIELVQDITTIERLDKDSMRKDEESSRFKNRKLFSFDDILTQDEEMIEIKRKAEIFSLSSKPTLIYGETGTGKELLAQSMILRSGVPRNKVVIHNCAAIPDSLLESTLFGSYKGAFTGAERVLGLFEMADEGILFLDELNSIPIHIQSKLLRVLQDGTFRPIGSEKEKKVRVKVIATTNEDPIKSMEDGLLRRDLFYRFAGNLLSIPSLKERQGDIIYYVDVFLKEASTLYDKNINGIDNDLKAFFLEYPWPGNVRELKHLLESMVNLSQRQILGLEDLPAYLYGFVKGQSTETKRSISLPLERSGYNLTSHLESIERQLICDVLAQEKGHLNRTAERLGLPRQTLSYKIKKLKIR